MRDWALRYEWGCDLRWPLVMITNYIRDCMGNE